MERGIAIAQSLLMDTHYKKRKALNVKFVESYSHNQINVYCVGFLPLQLVGEGWGEVLYRLYQFCFCNRHTHYFIIAFGVYQIFIADNFY